MESAANGWNPSATDKRRCNVKLSKHFFSTQLFVFCTATIFLVGCSARRVNLRAADERPGLATKAGEVRFSKVETVAFVRSDPTRPWGAAVIHYNDLQGISAQVEHRIRAVHCSNCAGGYRIDCTGNNCPLLTSIPVRRGIEVRVEDEQGRTLAGVNIAGRTYVMGTENRRYSLVVENKTTNRFEVVVSVDGLDVISRNPASMEQRGYIIDQRATLRIEGFRLDNQRVAAFRFGSVSQSLAAQTYGARNAGVIGVAVFSERHASMLQETRIRETADPFPSSGVSIPQI